MYFESAFLDEDHYCDIPNRPDPLKSNMPKYKKFILRFVMVSDKHPEVKKYYDCVNDILFEKLRQANSKTWFVMHPCSISCSIWDMFMFLVYILDIITTPFSMGPGILNVKISNIVAPLLLLHVLKQFFTAYVDKEMMMTVFEIRQIALHYLTGWFAVDFIGAFPWSATIEYLANLSGNKLDDDTRVHLRIMGLTSFMLVHQLFKCFNTMLNFFNATVRIIRFSRLLLITIYLVHWSASLCIVLPMYVHGTNLANVDDSWLNQVQNDEGTRLPYHEPMELYVHGLFRAVSLILGIGMGSTWPITMEDAYLSVVIMVLGRFFLFYCLEEIIGIGNFLRSPRAQYQIMMKRVKEFIRRRNLPPTTEKKVKMFYERRLNRSFFREKQLELLMSGSLRDELRNHDMRQLVRGSKLLSALPSATVSELLSCLTLDVFLPNDVVIRAGSLPQDVFFLASGSVAVYGRTGEELTHNIEGDFFGEMEIYLAGIDRNICSVVAIELCELYRLNGHDFMRFLRANAEARSVVESIAGERWNRTKLSDLLVKEYRIY